MAKINLYMSDLINHMKPSSINTNSQSLLDNSQQHIVETSSYIIFSINKPGFAFRLSQNNSDQISRPIDTGPTLDGQT